MIRELDFSHKILMPVQAGLTAQGLLTLHMFHEVIG